MPCKRSALRWSLLLLAAICTTACSSSGTTPDHGGSGDSRVLDHAVTFADRTASREASGDVARHDVLLPDGGAGGDSKGDNAELVSIKTDGTGKVAIASSAQDELRGGVLS